jgi:hypothetical protein
MRKSCAPHGIRDEKNGEAQTNRKNGGGHPRSPKQNIRIVAVEKFPPGFVLHHLKISVGNGRHAKKQPQERDCGDKFDERWILGISSEIETLPVPVTGENMHGFIEGLGLLPGRQREFRGHDGEQQSDSDNEPDPPRHTWFSIGHISENFGRKSFVARDFKPITAECRIEQEGKRLFPDRNS